jgi:hypothetical protein
MTYHATYVASSACLPAVPSTYVTLTVRTRHHPQVQYQPCMHALLCAYIHAHKHRSTVLLSQIPKHVRYVLLGCSIIPVSIESALHACMHAVLCMYYSTCVVRVYTHTHTHTSTATVLYYYKYPKHVRYVLLGFTTLYIYTSFDVPDNTRKAHHAHCTIYRSGLRRLPTNQHHPQLAHRKAYPFYRIACARESGHTNMHGLLNNVASPHKIETRSTKNNPPPCMHAWVKQLASHYVLAFIYTYSRSGDDD